MGFGLSVRRLVTEIFEHKHLKFAENWKITFFLGEPQKLNSEIFYCHRASSLNVSHRFFKLFRAAPVSLSNMQRNTATKIMR